MTTLLRWLEVLGIAPVSTAGSVKRLVSGEPPSDGSATAETLQAAQAVLGAQAAHGEFSFLGSIQLGAEPIKMILRGNLSEVLEDEPEIVARVFAALGSPFRVRLLRALLEGPRTSQELQTELAVATVGQLYHHLKELLAAGLIVQRKRSVYAIREEIVIPICMVFAVAPRLTSSQSSGARPEGTESPQAVSSHWPTPDPMFKRT
jgi:ArsR family transcriptional regulator, arsenate/arsenite/antimonite-responsive transcriptional repressor